MANYKITLTDTATYVIKADSEEMALEIACEWFEEREPDTKIELTNEPADNADEDEED